jgi:hypothetical protein
LTCVSLVLSHRAAASARVRRRMQAPDFPAGMPGSEAAGEPAHEYDVVELGPGDTVCVVLLGRGRFG